MHLGRAFIKGPERSEVVVPIDRHEPSNVREVSANQESLSIIVGVGIAIALMILIRWYPHLFKTISRSLGYLKESNHSHCQSCQFYHQNAYLQCAVHPTRVLTTEAQDCPDYCSRCGEQCCS